MEALCSPQPFMSVPPPPEHSSLLSAAGSKPHFAYKCLLNQHVQKLRKPPLVYQTQNEGAEHQPRFRSTVWVDGLSYTSSGTFQHRRMAEFDASRIAYIAITQKEKTDALQFIQEDKSFCKSVMAEFSAKKNIEKPVYKTTQLQVRIPVFCSCLLFNGVTYPGGSAKSKKEAEQLVARSVIIQLLASESGTDMLDIVNSKMRQYQDINGIQIGSNVLGAQAVVGHNFALTKSGTNAMAPDTLPSSNVSQPSIPQQLVEPITPAAPVSIQPPTSHLSTWSNLVQGTVIPAAFPSLGVPQSIIPQLSVERITPAVPATTEPPTRQVSSGSINSVVPLVTQLPTPHVSTDPIHPSIPVPVVTQPPTSQVSVEPIQPTANVIKQPKLEESSAQPMEYIPLVDQTSEKKRSRNSMRRSRKKMRADISTQWMPVTSATSQVLPFSSQ